MKLPRDLAAMLAAFGDFRRPLKHRRSAPYGIGHGHRLDRSEPSGERRTAGMVNGSESTGAGSSWPTGAPRTPDKSRPAVVAVRAAGGTLQGAQLTRAETTGGPLATLVRSAWILDADAECRAAVAMALEAAGYHDVVAFEAGRQLLAHRAREAAPALVVIDARTARFDACRIHRTLSGIPLVVVVWDGDDEPWRTLGVTRLLRIPRPHAAEGPRAHPAPTLSPN